MAYLDGTTRLGQHGGPRPQYAGFSAAAGTAAVVFNGTTESDVVAGGNTVVITLTNDTWVSSGATFNAQRQAIIDGLDSAQSEVLGWNAEVRDKEVVGAVVRTSDTVVTITLTAAAAYDITATETITATIPAAALVTSSIDITGTPTFTVTIVTAGVGAGRSRRRKQSRYPRRVWIEDKQYWVKSATEERQLLQRLLAKVRKAESQAKTAETKAKAHKRVIKVVKRLDTVATREQLWLEQLKRNDEEILLLLH